MMDAQNQVKKLFKFTLAAEHYLLAVDVISEIIRYRPVTQVPTIPEVVHGVLNLRGKYIPIIDLAKRLTANQHTEVDAKTCIVVTECSNKEQRVAVGLLVDEVVDFIDIDANEVSQPPEFGHSIASDLVEGMIRMDDEDYLILNVEKLLDLDKLIEILESNKEKEEDTIEPA
ncbi:chemotaxis protein CheW [Algicola sagamiensis]|uniref:chemotaxis protein CheW n=1 Tax=Algicola sagamiensis TaxID=163869 RepID=UPI000375DA12|nr:chemotaxis protein CheW [Algicola sagamiensis]